MSEMKFVCINLFVFFIKREKERKQRPLSAMLKFAKPRAIPKLFWLTACFF